MYIILGRMQEVQVLWSLSCDFYDGSIYWPKRFIDNNSCRLTKR